MIGSRAIIATAGLAAAGEECIIAPTVYHNNYPSALKALSRNAQPVAIIRALDFACK
jgi:hypothetical protein